MNYNPDYRPTKYNTGKIWYRMPFEMWLVRVKLLLAYYDIHELLQAQWKTWYEWKWDIPRAVHTAMRAKGYETDRGDVMFDWECEQIDRRIAKEKA